MKTAIALGLALILATTDARAQKAESAPPVLAERDRHAEGGRVVQVALGQTEIATSIDVGRIAGTGEGNSLLAMVILAPTERGIRGSLTQSARDRADAAAAPLRQSLQGFDVDALALATTQAAMAKPDWFQAQRVTRAADAGASELLASTGASQVALIDYHYDLSPDFTQIRVLADLSLMRRPGAKHMSGETASGVLYKQRILSVVQLRQRSYEPSENVARWNADNGKLAREALTAAFGAFEQLIPCALELTPQELQALSAKNHEKAFSAGFYGPLIARKGPEDILIWSNGLVHIQSVP